MRGLRADHPDIEHFIRAKERPGELTDFTLSVAAAEARPTASDKAPGPDKGRTVVCRRLPPAPASKGSQKTSRA